MLRPTLLPGVQQTIARPDGPDQEADSLVARADITAIEQQAQVEAAPVEARYSAALAVQIEAKQEQVERIEERLEALLARHAEALRQTQTQQPGFLSMPATRARWQHQVAQHQGALAMLQDRLEHVRELRDGMGVHGPRLEELATRKLRLQDPSLAAEFDDWGTAARQHQAIQRDQARRHRSPSTGTGLALSLDRGPQR